MKSGGVYVEGGKFDQVVSLLSAAEREGCVVRLCLCK